MQPGIVGDDDFTARLGGTGDLGACGVERRNRHVWRRKIDGKVDRLRQTALVACRIGFPQGNRVCAFCQWTRRRDAPGAVRQNGGGADNNAVIVNRDRAARFASARQTWL